MIHFKDLSIRKKLTIILVGTTTFAVLLACLAFYYLAISYYQQSYRNELISQAGIIGTNSMVALAFVVPEDAEKVLASLSNYPSIISARIYDGDGKLFASYGNLHHGSEPAESPMVVHNDIVMDGNVIGTITLFSDLRNIRAFQRMALTTLTLIVMIVLVFSFPVAAKLREIISRPIGELAALSQQVSETQDYTLRAEQRGADEIGNLAGAFNNMLATVEARNTDLIKSEQRFRALVDQAVDAFLLHDMDGRFIDVNQRACDSLGYSREELLKMTMAEIDPEISTEQYREKYWNNLFPESSITVESVYIRKDKASFPVEMRLGLLELNQQKYIMVLARDISQRLATAQEKEEMQSRLQQAQKMESIGTLAGGIAHDFNNILTAVTGYTELAQMKVEQGSRVAEDLRQIHKASQRAGELVRQILTFSRRHDQAMAPLQISLIVKEALKLLRSTIPTTIEIKQQITSSAMVLADPTQIHQLVMNLCTNAYHAMQETGGRLAVTLHEVDVDPEGIPGLDLPAGRYIKLEVADDGCGMTETVRANIFEPYFTTKEQGKGTGMGLAVVHGIVKSHHGRISVYSEPGQGTTFSVYLPMTGGEISDDTHEEEEGAPPASGNQRIMVVDDEGDIRTLLKSFLVGAGYRVEVFEDGRQAWKAFSRKPDDWDLLITDQTMPMMTGTALVKRVIELRPDLPIIICTGYSEMINAETAREMGVAAYLQKPLSRNELLNNVGRVLTGKENA